MDAEDYQSGGNMFLIHRRTLSGAVGGFARRNAKFSMILITLMAGIVLVGETTAKIRTVEAERFVLKAADGSVRAKLEASGDSTEFSLYNRAGSLGVAIKVSSTGSGLEVKDESGRVLAFMSVGLTSRSSTIEVIGNKGGPAVVLDADQDTAVMKLVDEAGHSVWLATSRPHPAMNQ
jgi:hypothetical protein